MARSAFGLLLTILSGVVGCFTDTGDGLTVAQESDATSSGASGVSMTATSTTTTSSSSTQSATSSTSTATSDTTGESSTTETMTSGTTQDPDTDTGLTTGTEGLVTTVVFVVPATANIYEAGMAETSNGTLPALINLPLGTGRSLVLSTVEGKVSLSASGGNDADGAPFRSDVPTPDVNGLAGSGVLGRQMIFNAVFLTGEQPPDTPPLKLDQADITFLTLSPATRQIFSVGDGLSGTGAGELQVINVPDDATRVFFGFYDSTLWGDPPQAYDDNAGSLAVTVEITSPDGG